MPDDEELLEAALAGDLHAGAQLCRRHERVLAKILWLGLALPEEECAAVYEELWTIDRLRFAREELTRVSAYSNAQEVLCRSLDTACRRRLTGRPRLEVAHARLSESENAALAALRDRPYDHQIVYFLHYWARLSIEAVGRVCGAGQQRIEIVLALAVAAVQNPRHLSLPGQHCLHLGYHFFYRMIPNDPPPVYGRRDEYLHLVDRWGYLLDGYCPPSVELIARPGAGRTSLLKRWLAEHSLVLGKPNEAQGEPGLLIMADLTPTHPQDDPWEGFLRELRTCGTVWCAADDEDLFVNLRERCGLIMFVGVTQASATHVLEFIARVEPAPRLLSIVVGDEPVFPDGGKVERLSLAPLKPHDGAQLLEYRRLSGSLTDRCAISRAFLNHPAALVGLVDYCHRQDPYPHSEYPLRNYPLLLVFHATDPIRALQLLSALSPGPLADFIQLGDGISACRIPDDCIAHFLVQFQQCVLGQEQAFACRWIQCFSPLLQTCIQCSPKSLPVLGEYP